MADNYIVLYPKYIAKIDAHAHSHYEQWDEWVECLDTEDKLKIIAGTTTYEQALRKAAEWVKSKGGKIIGFLGFTGGKLIELCDVKIHVKSEAGEYGPVEDAHLVMNHILAHWFQNKLK